MKDLILDKDAVKAPIEIKASIPDPTESKLVAAAFILGLINFVVLVLLLNPSDIAHIRIVVSLSSLESL